MDANGNVKDEQMMIGMNPALKSEQMQFNQMAFDPNFGYFNPNPMAFNPLPNPTLAPNPTLNVDLSDYPTPQELEPELCKVSADNVPAVHSKQEIHTEIPSAGAA